MRAPSFVARYRTTISAVLVIVLASLAAVGVGYGVVSLVDRISQTEQVNREQSTNLVRQACASANATALAFRDPIGDETRDHFADRLKGQRLTLQGAAGLGCRKLDGLGDFRSRRRDALAEIAALLDELRKGPGNAPAPSAKDLQTGATADAGPPVGDSPATPTSPDGSPNPPGGQGPPDDPAGPSTGGGSAIDGSDGDGGTTTVPDDDGGEGTTPTDPGHTGLGGILEGLGDLTEGATDGAADTTCKLSPQLCPKGP